MVIRTLVRMIQQVLTRIKIKQTHLIKHKQTHHPLKKQIKQKSRHLWGDGFLVHNKTSRFNRRFYRFIA